MRGLTSDNGEGLRPSDGGDRHGARSPEFCRRKSPWWGQSSKVKSREPEKETLEEKAPTATDLQARWYSVFSSLGVNALFCVGSRHSLIYQNFRARLDLPPMYLQFRSWREFSKIAFYSWFLPSWSFLASNPTTFDGFRAL
jgi:hypothetical protein